MKFREGKIIDKFTVEKNGKMIEVIIRYPKRSDLIQVWKFYNKVIKETQFLSRINPVSLKDEKKWLIDTLTKVKKNKAVQLFAEHNGKIIASCTVSLEEHETTRHIGHYGICILQEYTGLGLGTKLTEHVVMFSKEHLGAEILQLGVYSKNKIAQGLYRKIGFKVVGKIPKGVKHGKKYMDNIIMYKVLKK